MGLEIRIFFFFFEGETIFRFLQVCMQAFKPFANFPTLRQSNMFQASLFMYCTSYYRTLCLLRYVSDEDGSVSLDEVPLIMNSGEGFDTDESEYLMRPRGSRGAKKKGCCDSLCDCWKDCCAR